MQKIIYTLLTFILLTSTNLAQDFNGGILAGLATTEISGDRLEGPNKAGVYLGVYVNRYFSPVSSVQMELDYIQKGSRENPTEDNGYRSYLLRLNYVELPVHYKLDFAPKGTFETGLSLGVLVHSYELADGYEWVAGKDFDPIDLSFNIGLYYTLVDKMRLNIRYSNSVLPVRLHSGGATWRLNKGQYNEVLSFVLFWQF